MNNCNSMRRKNKNSNYNILLLKKNLNNITIKIIDGNNLSQRKEVKISKKEKCKKRKINSSIKD